MIRSLIEREAPSPWSDGGKIPWDDPAFSARMLREHLSQEHDRASRRSEIVEEHLSWIHEGVLGERPSRVLDLGCGPGLYCAGLAKRGHHCHGIDFSPASIEYATATSEGSGLSCTFEHGDLRTAEFGERWDLALLVYGEINTFPKEDALSLLRRAGEALSPGGEVLVEAHTEAAVRRFGAIPRSWSAQSQGLFGDSPHLVLSEAAWSEDARASTERYTVLSEDGSIQTWSSTTQAYSREEYGELLTAAGFDPPRDSPCLTGRTEPFDPNLFVLRARKPAATARD